MESEFPPPLLSRDSCDNLVVGTGSISCCDVKMASTEPVDADAETAWSFAALPHPRRVCIGRCWNRYSKPHTGGCGRHRCWEPDWVMPEAGIPPHYFTRGFEM